MGSHRQIYRNGYGQDIGGDGNCFFRCLSLYLYRDQKYFGNIRKKVLEYMSNDEKQTKAEKEKRFGQLIETQDDYDDYVKLHQRDGEYATDPLVQATADKYNLCIHVSKYMFYNGSTTTQLLKASPVQLSGKNRMSGNDREQLYLKLENDHYTFEKEENIKMNGDEWHDLITPISTSNGPDRFGDEHCRVALDNSKKDTSAFPSLRELDAGFGSDPKGDVDLKNSVKTNLKNFLSTVDENQKVRYNGLPYEPETSHGNKKPIISLRSAKNPVYSKNGSGTEENRNKDDSSTNSPTEKFAGIDLYGEEDEEDTYLEVNVSEEEEEDEEEPAAKFAGIDLYGEEDEEDTYLEVNVSEEEEEDEEEPAAKFAGIDLYGEEDEEDTYLEVNVSEEEEEDEEEPAAKYAGISDLLRDDDEEKTKVEVIENEKEEEDEEEPATKGMDISNIVWKKLEGATSLKLQMEAAQISFGTIFKVCRKIKMFRYQYFHFFMIFDIYDEYFKVVQVNYNFFRGPFLENRVVNFKDGDNSLFDFSCGGVYFEESNVLNKTDREAIRLRIKYFKSLCIHYGFGPNRWNCESVLNFIKYGNKRLLNRSEADIFKKRYCITGPLVLWTVERLSTVLLIEASIFQILGNRISKAKPCNCRNHP